MSNASKTLHEFAFSARFSPGCGTSEHASAASSADPTFPVSGTWLFQCCSQNQARSSTLSKFVEAVIVLFCARAPLKAFPNGRERAACGFKPGPLTWTMPYPVAGEGNHAGANATSARMLLGCCSAVGPALAAPNVCCPCTALHCSGACCTAAAVSRQRMHWSTLQFAGDCPKPQGHVGKSNARLLLGGGGPW